MEKTFQLRFAFQEYVDLKIPFYQTLSKYVRIQWIGINKTIHLYELSDDYTYLIAGGEVELHLPVASGIYRLSRIFGNGQAMCTILDSCSPLAFIKTRSKVRVFKLPKHRDAEILEALPQIEVLLTAIKEDNRRQDYNWKQLSEMPPVQLKNSLEDMFPAKKFKNTELQAMFRIPHNTFYRKRRLPPFDSDNPNFSINP